MKIKIILLSCLALLIIIITPFLSFDYGRQSTKNEIVILSLAHVDEFEGGVGSRASFLQRMGVEFTKKYKNIFIEVRQVTLSQLSENHEYDMISFSSNAAKILYENLLPYSSRINIRSEFVKSGSSGGNLYAVAWCHGGYALMKKNGKNNQVLFSGDSQKFKLDGYTFSPDKYTQYSAYEKFVSQNEYKYLLGTQRDIYRIIQKMQSGKLENVEITPYGGYTDLTQYIGCLANKSQSEAFIEFLTSDNIQKKITQIGMFSPTSIDIYADGAMGNLQNAMRENLLVENVFSEK